MAINDASAPTVPVAATSHARALEDTLRESATNGAVLEESGDQGPEAQDPGEVIPYVESVDRLDSALKQRESDKKPPGAKPKAKGQPKKKAVPKAKAKTHKTQTSKPKPPVKNEKEKKQSKPVAPSKKNEKTKKRKAALKMTRECVYSRAYHAAKSISLANNLLF